MLEQDWVVFQVDMAGTIGTSVSPYVPGTTSRSFCGTCSPGTVRRAFLHVPPRCSFLLVTAGSSPSASGKVSGGAAVERKTKRKKRTGYVNSLTNMQNKFHDEKKVPDEWQARQVKQYTSDTSNTCKQKKTQCTRKNRKKKNSKRPISLIGHCHPYRRKREAIY